MCRVVGVPFHLRKRTGEWIHTYQTEGAALVFMRDVIRVNGRQAAVQFALDSEDEQGQTRVMAEGMALVRRALQDWRPFRCGIEAALPLPRRSHAQGVERNPSMPANTNTILLVLALICFVVAALPIPKSPLNFTAIGLALLTASFLVA